jgi:hypothetical protein
MNTSGDCKKSRLGQFFTTNYEYILQNFFIPEQVHSIIEPFAGECDLLKFVKDTDKYSIECYDIDPKKDHIVQKDTLSNPPDYTNKFIITNPPYLARNKAEVKSLYDLYDTNDLYKCFIKQITKSDALGGILIIPLNFWCSIRKSDVLLRRYFLEKYDVVRMNVFEEQVFDDTSYTVCSFQFARKIDVVSRSQDYTLPIDIYPQEIRYTFTLNKDNNFTIGGEIYNLPVNSNYKITRLFKGDTPNTHIVAKCIDDSITNKIRLKLVDDTEIVYDDTPNKSARTYATLHITPTIRSEEQKKLVENFNKFMSVQREKYHSLFLTNYRESKSIARKRISFDLLYRIVGFLLKNSPTT